MPIDALSVLCAQLTRDLLAIAKFLLLMALIPTLCVQYPSLLMILNYQTLLTAIRTGICRNRTWPSGMVNQVANAIQRYKVHLGGNNQKFDYFMGSRKLEAVSQEKDLGVWITNI